MKTRSKCMNDIEPANLFKNAITSTRMKPKKPKRRSAKLVQKMFETSDEKKQTPPRKKRAKQKATNSVSAWDNTQIIDTDIIKTTPEIKNQSSESSIWKIENNGDKSNSNSIIASNSTTMDNSKVSLRKSKKPKTLKTSKSDGSHENTINIAKKRNNSTFEVSKGTKYDNATDSNSWGKKKKQKKIDNTDTSDSVRTSEKRNNSTFEVLKEIKCDDSSESKSWGKKKKQKNNTLNTSNSVRTSENSIQERNHSTFEVPKFDNSTDSNSWGKKNKQKKIDNTLETTNSVRTSENSIIFAKAKNNSTFEVPKFDNSTDSNSWGKKNKQKRIDNTPETTNNVRTSENSIIFAKEKNNSTFEAPKFDNSTDSNSWGKKNKQKRIDNTPETSNSVRTSENSIIFANEKNNSTFEVPKFDNSTDSNSWGKKNNQKKIVESNNTKGNNSTFEIRKRAKFGNSPDLYSWRKKETQKEIDNKLEGNCSRSSENKINIETKRNNSYNTFEVTKCDNSTDLNSWGKKKNEQKMNTPERNNSARSSKNTITIETKGKQTNLDNSTYSNSWGMKKNQQQINNTPERNNSARSSKNTITIETKGKQTQFDNSTDSNASGKKKKQQKLNNTLESNNSTRSSENTITNETKGNNFTFEIVHQTNDLDITNKMETSNQSAFIYTINDSTIFDSTNAGRKLSIFDQINNSNDYLKLEEISDAVINISDDSPVKNSPTKSPFNITIDRQNGTFIKDMSPDLDNDNRRDTYDAPVFNKSGEWHVQNQTNDNCNKTPENRRQETLENARISKIVLRTPPKKLEFDILDRSVRKQWQKHAVNSPGAKAVLEQINSPKPIKSGRKSTSAANFKNAKTPKINISARKSTNSIFKQTDDVPQKVKAMPNFALIHQKAFDKMESLQDYSIRKKERAKLLMSTDKARRSTSKTSVNKENTSRKLFENQHNRFGLKMKQSKIPIKSGHEKNGGTIVTQPEVSKMGKAPIYERKDLLAMANKVKSADENQSRNKVRKEVRGYRTNRRFELLMKMRNVE